MFSKRNGKIELLRFVFCISVVLYHAGYDVLEGDWAVTTHLSFFSEGRIGVEFFFLVSGYLAAKSALKQKNSGGTIGSNTFDFCVRKIKLIFPYYILAVLASTLSLLLFSKDFLHDFAVRLPSAFLLQRTGISDTDFVTVAWYICSLLLALAIIYPLLLKNFDMTTLVVAPVVSSLLIGYMTKTYGQMPTNSLFLGVTYAGNIRGFAVVLLGCFCYAVGEKIKAKRQEFSLLQRKLLAAVENACWLISMFFMVSRISAVYEAYIVYFMALGVTLTFSRDFTSNIYDRRWVYYLGRLSLPIYLFQNIARAVVNYKLFHLPVQLQIFIILALAVIIGVSADAMLKILKSHKWEKGKRPV